VKFVQHQNTFKELSDPEYLGPDVERGGDKTFMMNGFGWGAGIQDTQPITEDMEMLLAGNHDLDLTLGGDKVVAKYFGLAQTEGDLFVWHERSRTLYTGNPVLAAYGPTMPWLLDGHLQGALQAMRNLRTFVDGQAMPTTIVPAHGTFYSSKNFSVRGDYIDYFTELHNLAVEAVAAGVNLTKAQAQMQQPGYSGYGVYPWVQNSINIPFAFVEAGGKIAKGETCGGVCFPPQGYGTRRKGSACDYCASGQCVSKGKDMFGVVGTCA